MSYIGRSSDGFGLLNKYRWVASGSETSIAPTLADSNGKLLRFTDKNLVHLFLNGVKLDQTDFNLDTTNQISGLSALAANDILEAHVYDVFSIATIDTVSATDGGTFSGNIIVSSTDAGASADPTLTLYRNSASPADWDILGEIIFRGRNWDGSATVHDVDYAKLVAQTVDVTDGTEDGRLVIQQQKASTLTDTYIFDHDKFQFNDEQKIQWKNHGGTSYEVDLVAGTPTATRTITLPDATGTAVLTGVTGEADITGGTVDINASFGDITIDAVGGNLLVNGNTGNMTFTNTGTGDILLGNFKFDSDQTVGSGQDNYVLTYDHSTTKISLEAAAGGGASNLNGLSDVTIASVANNDLLKYNSTAGEWQNTNLGLTVTPTVSVTSGDYYDDANSITISVTNHSSYDLPAYSVEVRRQDNNNLIFNMDSISSTTEAIDITTDTLTEEGRPTGEIIINTGQSASNFDTVTTDNFKILVLAQDFGDLQSEVATLNVSVVARPQVSFDSSTAYRYWRMADFDERVFLTGWKAYSAINQGGTAYPTTEAISSGAHPSDEHIQSWTSDSQTNVAKSNFAYSTTYSTADPFNDSAAHGWWTINDTTSSYWSTDNGFSAPSAYEDEQILLVWDMGTARTIKSMKFVFNDSYTNTVASGDNAFIVQGSNDESSWTTVCTVQESDQSFSASSGTTTVLVSDTS